MEHSKTNDLLDFHEDIRASIQVDKVRIAQNILGKHFDIVRYEQVDLQNENLHSDVHFTIRNGRNIHCDLKHYSPGRWASTIALEMFSDIESSNGWTWNLKRNHVDFVLFIWHGKAKLCYLLVNAPMLEDWFRKNHTNYYLHKNKITIDRTTGNKWQSAYMNVPIKDLPKELIAFWERFTDLNDFVIGDSHLNCSINRY